MEMRLIVILLVIFTAKSTGDFDLEELMGKMGSSTKETMCPSGHVPAQVANKRAESNGCSKPKGIQVNGEEDFTYCCDRHDACYATCGLTKQYCDKDFGKCMKSMCKSTFSHNSECNDAADL